MSNLTWKEMHESVVEQLVHLQKENAELRAKLDAWEKQDKFCDNNCAWTDHHPDCTVTKPKDIT